MLIFVIKNRDLFLSNSEIHNINIWINYNLHLTSTNITLVQKGVLYSGSTIYNHLQLHIKNLSKDTKLFKSTLKNFLLQHMFWMNIISQHSNDHGSYFLLFITILTTIIYYLFVLLKYFHSIVSFLLILCNFDVLAELWQVLCTLYVLLWLIPYL